MLCRPMSFRDSSVSCIIKFSLSESFEALHVIGCFVGHILLLQSHSETNLYLFLHYIAIPFNIIRSYKFSMKAGPKFDNTDTIIQCRRNSYWRGGGLPFVLLPMYYTVIKGIYYSLTIIGELQPSMIWMIMLLSLIGK